MSILLVKLASLQPASNRLSPPICRLFLSTNNAANKIIDKTEDRASPEQLALIEKRLVEHLPRFFIEPHPYNIYTQDVIFIDNIRNLKSQGLPMYVTHASLIKIYHHLRYSSKKVEVLNLVKNPEESYIRIRWRIVSTPGLLGSLLHVSKFKLRAGEKWQDGISTMLVNKNGLIHRHVCDNIEVETNEANGTNKHKQSVKNPLYC